MQLLKTACIYIDENLEKNLLGGLVIFDPASLQEIIIDIQNQRQFYDELKFSKISDTKLHLYKKILEVVSWYKYKQFFIKQHPKNLKTVDYSNFVKDIIEHIKDIDVFLVFVDYFSVPKSIQFEQFILETNIKVIFCLREDSKSNKLLQITDLILGSHANVLIPTITSINKIDLIDYYKSLSLSQEVFLI